MQGCKGRCKFQYYANTFGWPANIITLALRKVRYLLLFHNKADQINEEYPERNLLFEGKCLVSVVFFLIRRFSLTKQLGILRFNT